ncbi:MAG: hypothetical protein U0V72_01730 [Cytophagales bacterium]
MKSFFKNPLLWVFILVVIIATWKYQENKKNILSDYNDLLENNPETDDSKTEYQEHESNSDFLNKFYKKDSTKNPGEYGLTDDSVKKIIAEKKAVTGEKDSTKVVTESVLNEEEINYIIRKSAEQEKNK